MPSARPPLGEGARPRIAPALQALALPIDAIELHPRNPRIGNAEAVAASLLRFGQLKPIVVQKSTMFCVAGNHVLRAARLLGWPEIAANVETMDDAAATAFMLADNRTSDLGTYDDDLLAAILAEQAAADNLAATGYDPDDVAALLRATGRADERDADAVPDLPPESDVFVRPGELWVLGRHRLLVGDATDPEAVARLTAGAPVDLVLSHTSLRAEPVHPDRDKVTRALTLAARYEAHKVFHLRSAPGLADFEDELVAFPNGQHDDQVDAAVFGAALGAPPPVVRSAPFPGGRGWMVVRRQPQPPTRPWPRRG